MTIWLPLRSSSLPGALRHVLAIVRIAWQAFSTEDRNNSWNIHFQEQVMYFSILLQYCPFIHNPYNNQDCRKYCYPYLPGTVYPSILIAKRHLQDIDCTSPNDVLSAITLNLYWTINTIGLRYFCKIMKGNLLYDLPSYK